MKLSSFVLLGAAALLFGVYVNHRAGDVAPSDIMSASALQPEPKASMLGAFSDEELATVVASDRTAEDGQSKEMTTLSGEVALLKAQVSTLQRQMQELSRAATVADSGTGEDPANDPRDDSAARAEAERRRQKQMEALEANFRQESTDSPWSSEAETAVQEALAGDKSASTALRSVECRSNTCRVEMVDDNSGKLAMLVPLFVHRLAKTLPYSMANQVDEGNGAKAMILYMSREANEPPRNGG